MAKVTEDKIPAWIAAIRRKDGDRFAGGQLFLYCMPQPSERMARNWAAAFEPPALIEQITKVYVDKEHQVPKSVRDMDLAQAIARKLFINEGGINPMFLRMELPNKTEAGAWSENDVVLLIFELLKDGDF